MTTTTIFGIATVPAIMGLVEAASTAGLPKNLAPLAAILLGIGAGILSHSTGGISWEQAIAGGIALGLAASGLYSSGKQVGGAIKLRYRRNKMRKLANAHRRTDGRTDREPPLAQRNPDTAPIVTKGTVEARGRTPDKAPTQEQS